MLSASTGAGTHEYSLFKDVVWIFCFCVVIFDTLGVNTVALTWAEYILENVDKWDHHNWHPSFLRAVALSRILPTRSLPSFNCLDTTNSHFRTTSGWCILTYFDELRTNIFFFLRSDTSILSSLSSSSSSLTFRLSLRWHRVLDNQLVKWKKTS
jgi:hypothetical protein